MKILKRKNTNVEVPEPVEPVDFGQPFTGGNAFMNEQLLKALDEFNKSTIPKAINNPPNIQNDYYDFYRTLLFQAQYFVNRFNLRCEDKELQEAIYKSIWAGFMYGRGGVWKKGEHYLPFAVNTIKMNNIGEIIELSIIPTNWFLNSNVQLDMENFESDCVITLTKAQIAEVVIYTNNVHGHTALFRYKSFIDQYMYWQKVILNQRYIVSKKLAYNVNDPNTTDEELKSLVDPTLPIVKIRTTVSKNGDAIANKFDVLETDNSGTVELKEIYLLWKSEMYELIGREFLQDPKAERKISAEVDQSNAAHASNEYDAYNQLDIYKYRLEKKFNMELTLGNFNIDKDKLNMNGEEDTNEIERQTNDWGMGTNTTKQV